MVWDFVEPDGTRRLQTNYGPTSKKSVQSKPKNREELWSVILEEFQKLPMEYIKKFSIQCPAVSML